VVRAATFCGCGSEFRGAEAVGGGLKERTSSLVSGKNAANFPRFGRLWENQPRKAQGFYAVPGIFPTRPNREFFGGEGIEIPYSAESRDISRLTRRALGHPEKIVDFGWRAIHLTALASKAIVADYCGTAPRHAYFSGCSDGGREALVEAQRFPQDYDGIVAGAPASDWTKLLNNAVWFEQAVDQPNAWLSPEKLSIVTKAVLATCHGDDGYLGKWTGPPGRGPSAQPLENKPQVEIAIPSWRAMPRGRSESAFPFCR
jgi:Tannase and feruloyl esterase